MLEAAHAIALGFGKRARIGPSVVLDSVARDHGAGAIFAPSAVHEYGRCALGGQQRQNRLHLIGGRRRPWAKGNIAVQHPKTFSLRFFTNGTGAGFAKVDHKPDVERGSQIVKRQGGRLGTPVNRGANLAEITDVSRGRISSRKPIAAEREECNAHA